MGFLGLVQHPGGEGHFVLPENISQILVLRDFLLHLSHDFLRLSGGYGVLQGGLDLCGDGLLDELHCSFQQSVSGVGLLHSGLLIGGFQCLVRFQVKGKLGVCDLLRDDLLCLDDVARLENGVALLCLGQNVGKLVVGGQHDRVYIPVAGARPIGQTKTPAHHLFPQDFGRRGTQRHNGVEVVDVPALFQHIDMDDDFHRIIRTLHIQQQAGVGLAFRALLL